MFAVTASVCRTVIVTKYK